MALLEARKPKEADWLIAQRKERQQKERARLRAAEKEHAAKMKKLGGAREPSRPPRTKRKPRTASEFKGRAIGRKRSEVQQLRPGDLVRFNHRGRSLVAGTIIEHNRTKKGSWRSLVHVHSTGELIHVPHTHVTHVKKVTAKRDRMIHLRNARTAAQGHRSSTQRLKPFDAERLMAAGRASKVDQVLRSQGADVPAIEPKEPERAPYTRGRLGTRAEGDRLHPDRPVEHIRIGRAPPPPFEAGNFRHVNTPVAEAHPQHLRPGDDVLFYAPVPGARPGATQRPALDIGRHGIVIGHNRPAGVLHVYDTGQRRVRLVPYGHVHHVRHLPRSERMRNVRSRIGGKHRAPALAQARADSSRHRRLTDFDGLPAYFRTPTYLSPGGHFPHGGTAYPSAPGDTLNEEIDFGRGGEDAAMAAVGFEGEIEQFPNHRRVPVHAMGGLEPYIEMTTPEGEFREAEPQDHAKIIPEGFEEFREARGSRRGRLYSLRPGHRVRVRRAGREIDAFVVSHTGAGRMHLFGGGEHFEALHDEITRTHTFLSTRRRRRRRLSEAYLASKGTRWEEASRASYSELTRNLLESAAEEPLQEFGIHSQHAEHIERLYAAGPEEIARSASREEITAAHHYLRSAGHHKLADKMIVAKQRPNIGVADPRLHAAIHGVGGHWKARLAFQAVQHMAAHMHPSIGATTEAVDGAAAAMRRIETRPRRPVRMEGTLAPHFATSPIFAEAELVEAGKHTGMMVALYPPPELAHKLAIAGGEDPKELHVTLAFLGKDPVDVGKLRRVVAGWAAATPPVEGRITGLKLFTASKHSEGKMVTCAGVSAHELDGHRGRLVGALKGAGFGPAENFPFSPHLTLAYGDRRNIELPDHAVAFKNATLKVGDQRFDFPLHGQPFA